MRLTFIEPGKGVGPGGTFCGPDAIQRTMRRAEKNRKTPPAFANQRTGLAFLSCGKSGAFPAKLVLCPVLNLVLTTAFPSSARSGPDDGASGSAQIRGLAARGQRDRLARLKPRPKTTNRTAIENGP